LTNIDKYPKLGYDWAEVIMRVMNTQAPLFEKKRLTTEPLKQQLLKWIGNKQRFAPQIVSLFPDNYNNYYEPFLGSGAVLATLSPREGIGSDNFSLLIGIWKKLKEYPEMLKQWYRDRWKLMKNGDKIKGYEKIKASFNNNPNSADLLFLSRSCYGGVVRFRKSDGYMSTPCGIHEPISPESFALRVDEWALRVKGCDFNCMDYEEAMDLTAKGDLIYCDPPYKDTQKILYGAQDFSLENLMEIIERCKNRGVYVALSIDGTKYSGGKKIDLPIPGGLFEREFFINNGSSMLKRFQMNGKTTESELVSDRLLLTY
jgi:DNA adenine methylase